MCLLAHVYMRITIVYVRKVVDVVCVDRPSAWAGTRFWMAGGGEFRALIGAREKMNGGGFVRPCSAVST